MPESNTVLFLSCCVVRIARLQPVSGYLLFATHTNAMFYWCIDVVTAYKELQREKIALEESLKALSVSRPSSDEYPIQAQKDVDLASEHLAEDSSICSELSDSLVTHVKYLLLYMYLGWLRIRNSILDR